MQLFLEYVDTKEVQIVYYPQILQGKPMEKPCKHLQCRGKFVISGQRMAKPTQLCHKNTFIFRFEKPNLFQNAITLIRNETITSICYFCVPKYIGLRRNGRFVSIFPPTKAISEKDASFWDRLLFGALEYTGLRRNGRFVSIFPPTKAI